MECNKDEAVRCRLIAERKLGQNDASGAKKFAYKARQLYPELDGLSQLISVLEVHSAAASTSVSVPVGDSDWYGILQVDHSADEATIRKQYRKLALLLHPDKNKMQGAEAAFKLVSEAWSILSDKPRKAAYDMRRNGSFISLSQSMKQSRGAAAAAGGPPQPTTNNGFCSFVRTSSTNQRPPPPPPPPPPISKPLTFWTSCPSCKMQYEYLRIYENRNLCCPMCRQPFLAKETQIVGAHAWRNVPEPTPPPPPPPPGFRTGNGSVNNNTNFSWGAFKNAATAEQVVRETFEKVKRERFEAQKELKKKEHKEKDQKKKERELQKAQEVAKAKEVFVQMMAKARSVFEQKPLADQASKRKAEVTPPPSNTGNRNMEEPLAASGKFQSAKLDSPVSKKAAKQPGNGKRKVSSGRENDGSHPLKKIRAESPQHAKEKKLDNDVARNSSSVNLHSAKTSTDTATDDGIDTSLSKLPSVSIDEDAINVPDPDFYDFDKDRTEKHFAAGQVWAVYDESNGMPRFYARINRVFSSQPFKIHMSWLEPHFLSKDAQEWLDFGLQCPCGEFKVRKSQMNEHVNTFSHLMEVRKGQRGSLKIYPRKGEIWALYKGWNESLQPQDVTHIYDVVEMLSDFREEEGVSVALLSKMENYTAVFRKGEADAFSVSARELLRFSHQVPAHQLTAEDMDGLLEGCWELDPAAIPLTMITSRGGD